MYTSLKSIVAGFLGLIVPCLYGYATDTIPANDPLIEFTGRIDFSDPAAPRFSYSGVSIRAGFTGTSLSVIMDDNVGENYYAVLIDGRMLDPVKITTGKKAYTIAEGLENGDHEVEMFKRTEELFGKTQFFGFVVDEGSGVIPLGNEREKLIEYIGNSITCGYGNEGALGESFGASTENHYMTYAAITSRNFNARHLAVCKSGIGVYRNYNGPPTGNSDCMTNYYTRIFFNDEEPLYDFSETPDLICINLGTNDFSTNEGDSALFVSNYLRLIDTLQTRYLMPEIICLLGPMISEPILSDIREYLNFIADSASRKGMGSVSFYEMSQQTGSLGYAIDYHPTVAQHTKNGLELTDYIRSLKGWKLNPLLLQAEVTETRHIQLEFNTAVIDSVNNYHGIAVFANDENNSVDSVFRDPVNYKILHVLTAQAINIGDRINISYTPGTIYSEDSMAVRNINYFSATNRLSETLFTKGVTTSDGMRITLTCNKSINSHSSLEGLILKNGNDEELQVDSFSISNTQLVLYLQNAVSKDDSVFAAYSGSDFLGADGIVLSHFDKLVIQNYSTYTGLMGNYRVNTVIYPNPNTSGVLCYRFNDFHFEGSTVSYKIINSTGITVQAGRLQPIEGQIALCAELTSGIYYLQFGMGDKSPCIAPVKLDYRVSTR